MQNKIFRTILIAVAMLVVVATIAHVWRSNQNTTTAGQPRNILGQPDAPNIIEIYEDYQCQYCASLTANTVQQLRDTLVKAGNVQIHFRHFPFLSPESTTAAIASECAAQQDHFWDYHDLLFVATLNDESYGQPLYEEIAELLAMDIEPWRDCLETDEPARLVKRDLNLGRSEGVRATPHIVINGKHYTGPRDYITITQLLKETQVPTTP